MTPENVILALLSYIIAHMFYLTRKISKMEGKLCVLLYEVDLTKLDKKKEVD